MDCSKIHVAHGGNSAPGDFSFDERDDVDLQTSTFQIGLGISGENTSNTEGLGMWNHTDSKSTGDGQQCCVCLDINTRGIKCSEGHFVCQMSCFSSLVKNVCEETYRLRASKGRIRCPVPNCSSVAWSSKEVRECIASDNYSLDMYTDALVSLFDSGVEINIDYSKNTPRLDRLQAMVRDALTLTCPNPNCRLALDPNPDGCSSIKCLKCGCYFCWFCFSLSGLDSAGSHNHVIMCPESPQPGSVFVAQELMGPVHKRRRIEAIRKSLLTVGEFKIFFYSISCNFYEYQFGVCIKSFTWIHICI